jgi:hypothetical protein
MLKSRLKSKLNKRKRTRYRILALNSSLFKCSAVTIPSGAGQ